MDNKDKVLHALRSSDSPMRAGDLSDITGLEKKDVDKAMKLLKEEGLIVSPKRCFWQAK